MKKSQRDTGRAEKAAGLSVRALAWVAAGPPALAWVAAGLPALAWVAAGLAALAVAAPLGKSVWIYLLFSAVCHQQPERALWVAGGPLAVCARCCGIYVGLALGLLLGGSRCQAAGHGFAAQQRWLAAAVALLAADLASEWLGLRPAWAAGRLLSGFLLGVMAALFLVAGNRRGPAPSSPGAVRQGVQS